MRRSPLAVLLALVAAGIPAAAHADSTATQAVPAGGSMRSSPDIAPSPANPVIVTVSTANGSPATITITSTDRTDAGPDGNAEGPSGFLYMGPRFDITSPDTTQMKLVFQVDGSLGLPGFIALSDGINGHQFFLHSVGTGRQETTGFNFMYDVFDGEQTTADGDHVLTMNSAFPGKFEPLQQSFYSMLYARDDSLPEARKDGVPVYLKTNFRSTLHWTVTVSSAVAHKLHLKSTTIAEKTFDNSRGGNQRIPMTAAARKALRRYSRVAVRVNSVAKGPNDEVIRDKDAITLSTPPSELG